MEAAKLSEWAQDAAADGTPAARWTLIEGGARVTAAPGSDLFHMPGIRSIDHIGMLGRETGGDFTLTARVSVEGDTFADAAGLLLRAGDVWLKACVERTKSGRFHLVTVASCPSSDESYGADVGGPAASLLVTRQARRVAVFWRALDAERWQFARTLYWASPAPLRAGLFAQAPFSQAVRATFNEVQWSSEALSDRR